jgi:hypothetical protein
VPGRKSDVLDCQWLRQLHSYGLLSGSFRPDDSICVLRSYIRQRDTLIADAARLGSPKAITATAHKLARIFYHMWTTRQSIMILEPAITTSNTSIASSSSQIT